MKKIYVIFFITIMSVLLASCDAEKNEVPTENVENTAEVTEESTTGIYTETLDCTEENSAESTSEKTSEKITEATSEYMTEMKEEYSDISYHTSPKIEVNKKNTVTVTSQSSDRSNTSIVFDGNSEFTISRLDISGIHDCSECSECGFKETENGVAYHICKNSQYQGGFTIELAKPITAALFSGMTVTYTSSHDITASQIRILRYDGVTNDGFINKCPSMSGAVGQWKTVDLGLTKSDLAELADGDGAIRSFKLYFRDKDGTDIYIKSIDLDISYEGLCAIDLISENCFYKGHAVALVAEKIASRLSSVGIESEITVKASAYTQNTAAKSGWLLYNVTITLPDGSEKTVKDLSVNISPISNCWLERESSPYGAVTDSKEQWKQRFDRGGLLYLENNTFDCTDALKTVEYAVIGNNDDVTADSVKWYEPQNLEINDDTFSVFANAFLDYGRSLISGEQYRFVVRAVTQNNNYVLHLDIPFTYEPFDAETESELQKITDIVNNFQYGFDDGENIELNIKSDLEKLIDNENVEILSEVISKGMSRTTIGVKILYVGDVDSDRFPIRPNNSNKLYAYSGDYVDFTFTIHFNASTSPISLISPDDGARDIAIASSYIIDHMNADISFLTSAKYPFVKEERCDPPAITFEWTGDGCDNYTLILSESMDMTSPMTYSVKKTDDSLYVSIDVTNLKAGTTYYWQVSSNNNLSCIFCFTTADFPRFILTDNVSNFRDIGGYVTIDGKRVKQGLAYRSAQLEAVTANDIAIITKQLGIRTDLDLRGQSTVSPLGKNINVIRASIQWYTGVFEEENQNALKNAISEFAVETNYPMVYHCAIGRDRTGTVTMLILGLLGVDEETLIREYLLSFNSVAGHDGTPGYVMVQNAQNFIDGLKTYGTEGATLSEHTEVFLLHIGVTEQDIQSIKDILLEE